MEAGQNKEYHICCKIGKKDKNDHYLQAKKEIKQKHERMQSAINDSVPKVKI